MANTPPEPYAYISHRQEAFSEAYIRAICAVVGCSVQRLQIDNDKIDLTVSSRLAGSMYTKPSIGIQVKCMLGDAANSDPISYSVDIDTYNNLRDPLVASPRILVVVLAPNQPDEWTVQTEAQLALMHCAYWATLKGLPDVDNGSTKTVYLPRANVFTPDALRAMMQKTADGVDFA